MSLVLIYFVARWLDMFLTQWLFHAGLTVIILAILVLFQEDARRHLERLLDWRSWLGGATFHSFAVADPIIEALTQMARDRIGALVVLPGTDPLERHIRGGIQIDGLVSVPLLLSLFDSSSPGHDGAIVIEGNRVRRFAIHLPLSRRVYATQGGTRHTAALGLAERCDALVFVVSEERGVISIAREGEIRETTSTAELGQELETFLAAHGAARENEQVSRRLIGSHGTKLSALVIAATLWGMLVWDVEPVQRTFAVPVEFRSVPEQWSVHEVEPSEVRVTLDGPANQFQLLDSEQLRFSLAMEERRPGLHSIWLDAQALQVPSGLEVSAIDPQWVWFQVSRRSPAGSGTAADTLSP
jgi:diadenylate cyclase